MKNLLCCIFVLVCTSAFSSAFAEENISFVTVSGNSLKVSMETRTDGAIALLEGSRVVYRLQKTPFVLKVEGSMRIDASRYTERYSAGVGGCVEGQVVCFSAMTVGRVFSPSPTPTPVVHTFGLAKVDASIIVKGMLMHGSYAWVSNGSTVSVGHRATVSVEKRWHKYLSSGITAYSESFAVEEGSTMEIVDNTGIQINALVVRW